MKLALIGDLHYPRRLFDPEEAEATRDGFYEAVLEAFLSIEADYHISLGDLTHEGEAEAFEAVFEFARRRHPERPLFYVLGNHDTYSLSKADIRRLTGMPRYGVVETEEARLLFLDTARDANRDDWGGTLDEEQLEWLGRLLREEDNRPFLLFAHHPAPGTTARSTEFRMGLDAEPGYKLLSMLEGRGGPTVCFHGHNHMQSLVRRGKLLFFQAACALDIPVAWLLTVNDTGLFAESLPLLVGRSEEQVREWTSVIGRNMDDYERYPRAEGVGCPSEWTVEWAEAEAAAVEDEAAR